MGVVGKKGLVGRRGSPEGRGLKEECKLLGENCREVTKKFALAYALSEV